MIKFIIDYCRTKWQVFNSYKIDPKITTQPSEEYMKGKADAYQDMIRYLENLNDFLLTIKGNDEYD